VDCRRTTRWAMQAPGQGIKPVRISSRFLSSFFFFPWWGRSFHRSHQMLTLVAPLQRTQHNSIALLESISASTNIQSIFPHHIAEQGISNRWATIRTVLTPQSSKHFRQWCFFTHCRCQVQRASFVSFVVCKIWLPW
jgi:hypothetical protein